MKLFLAILGFSLGMTQLTARAEEHFESGPARTALLELYTSEGCSSCPPAEAQLSRLKSDPGLWKQMVPVAYHVDYWDRLGWRDRFASPAWTARQNRYASLWQSESVYTPAFVLNGREMRGGLGEISSPNDNGGRLRASSADGHTWAVEYSPPAGTPAGEWEAHVALLGAGISSKIGGGENGGRNLEHDFVVLTQQDFPLQATGDHASASLTIKAPAENVPRKALAVWVTRRGELAPVQATGGWLAARQGRVRGSWLKRIALGVLALLFCAGATLLLWRVLAQHRVARAVAIAVPPGIDQLEAVSLGGLPQWISLRGHDRRKPMLLFLHGGPGFPQMPFMENNALLEDDFVVVQWDQRGAGKSFRGSISAQTMNVGQLVADAHQLVGLLRARDGGQKIFLCAHSFGTILGALLAAEHPEDFRAYVGISQIGDMMMTEKLLYDFALGYARAHGRRDAERELQQLGPPPHQSKAALESVIKWSHEFGGELHQQTRPEDLLTRAWSSPQYSLLDDLNILRGAAFSSQHLWRESYQISLFERAPRIDVPVFFLAGRHDYAVTATVAHRYFDALQAPRGKEFIWFENSSHFPDFEEPAKYQQVMRRISQVGGR